MLRFLFVLSNGVVFLLDRGSKCLKFWQILKNYRIIFEYLIVIFSIDEVGGCYVGDYQVVCWVIRGYFLC